MISLNDILKSLLILSIQEFNFEEEYPDCFFK